MGKISQPDIHLYFFFPFSVVLHLSRKCFESQVQKKRHLFKYTLPSRGVLRDLSQNIQSPSEDKIRNNCIILWTFDLSLMMNVTWPIHGIPHCAPNVSWAQLQPSATLQRISTLQIMDNWILVLEIYIQDWRQEALCCIWTDLKVLSQSVSTLNLFKNQVLCFSENWPVIAALPQGVSVALHSCHDRLSQFIQYEPLSDWSVCSVSAVKRDTEERAPVLPLWNEDDEWLQPL